MWYVVQVKCGREEAARKMIERVVAEGFDSGLLEECFVPRYRTMRKVGGQFVYGLETLFSGYLIAVTTQVDRLKVALQSVPAFTKLLGNDKAFIPLNNDEIAWICAFTQQDNRAIEISEGFVEGGRVVVTHGPLVGREGLIKRINRRKRTAYLQLQLMGRTVETKVGLNLVKHRN